MPDPSGLIEDDGGRGEHHEPVEPVLHRDIEKRCDPPEQREQERCFDVVEGGIEDSAVGHVAGDDFDTSGEVLLACVP